MVTGGCGLGKSALLAHWSDLVNNDMPMIPIYHRLDSTTLSSYPETLARMLASKCQNALKHQSLGEENLFAAEVAKETGLGPKYCQIHHGRREKLGFDGRCWLEHFFREHTSKPQGD